MNLLKPQKPEFKYFKKEISKKDHKHLKEDNFDMANTKPVFKSVSKLKLKKLPPANEEAVDKKR